MDLGKDLVAWAFAKRDTGEDKVLAQWSASFALNGEVLGSIPTDD